MAINTYSVILPTLILLITVVLISIVLGRMIKNEMTNIGTLYVLDKSIITSEIHEKFIYIFCKVLIRNTVKQ